ncbi:uncharacterized protein LOC131144775 isoform X2 [Malania oleifera]|uniref:uncharacterized protein LOC131144775 isoform X2 n=1 Tax=Malania oleifera TaxID=397392 RepID=UPI0025ADE84B|nr:uncharacterized protein LOC131144775 isoform X2 [Malania oleifera]
MLERKNAANGGEKPTALRRSPRFLQQEVTPESIGSQENPKPKFKKSRVEAELDFPLSSSASVSRKRTQEDYPEKVLNNLNESSDGLIKRVNSSAVLRRSQRVNNGAAGIQSRRRSPRFQNQRKMDEREQKTSGDMNDKFTKRVSRESINLENISGGLEKSDDGLRKCTNLSPLKNSRRVTNRVAGTQSIRRSPRFLCQVEFDERAEKASDSKNNRFIERSLSESVDRGVSLGLWKDNMGANLCEKFARKRERSFRSNSADSVGIEIGGKSEAAGVDKEGGYIGNRREIEEGMECDWLVQAWTEEQELALHKAYFTLKPTPHFWKKVPGKSAQDCFDKVHSDHLTPPQAQPRSRVKKTDLSPLGYCSLSASKLLKPTKPKSGRVIRDKRKSHLTQKTVRGLLQKQCHVDQGYELDLFSVLEPTANLSTSAFQQNVMFSTPENVKGKVELYQKHRERSSRHKILSRFSSSGMVLVSPPVLKQVKNRALHEKYIDQLHCREAKRKAALARAAKSIPEKGDRNETHIQKKDMVRAAKNALVSDAQDAIHQFQQKEANATSELSEFDEDGLDCDNDEGDDEL